MSSFVRSFNRQSRVCETFEPLSKPMAFVLPIHPTICLSHEAYERILRRHMPPSTAHERQASEFLRVEVREDAPHAIPWQEIDQRLFFFLVDVGDAAVVGFEMAHVVLDVIRVGGVGFDGGVGVGGVGGASLSEQRED